MAEDEERIPEAADIDCLFRETDRLYHEVARGCGLSDCAYWVLYAVVRAEGRIGMADLVATWSYSRQTTCSAVKSLERRGLVSVSFVEGSRKRKLVSLTAEGEAFSERAIVPAVRAERRAFDSLPLWERRDLVRLVGDYTRAIDAELGRLSAPDDGATGKGE